jgi:hypothetical protein
VDLLDLGDRGQRHPDQGLEALAVPSDQVGLLVDRHEDIVLAVGGLVLADDRLQRVEEGLGFAVGVRVDELGDRVLREGRGGEVVFVAGDDLDAALPQAPGCREGAPGAPVGQDDSHALPPRTVQRAAHPPAFASVCVIDGRKSKRYA